MSTILSQFRRKPGGWLILPSVLLVIVLMLAQVEATQAAPIQQSQPTCQSCHPDAFAAWKDTSHAKALLNPAMKEQLSKSTGQTVVEGVTCEVCHGAYQQGHPATQTMKLPMDSATCRTCHRTAVAEWEQSKHATNKIECFDCHNSHSQGLRTGSQQKLCAACHTNEQTEFAHTTHGISGQLDCGTCHMAKTMQDSANAAGSKLSQSSHSFTVPSQMCSSCHSNTIHASNPTGKTSQPAVQARTVGQAAPVYSREAELEQQISELQSRLTMLRNAGVVSMGLALGFGAFAGLIFGIVGMSLWRRSRDR